MTSSALFIFQLLGINQFSRTQNFHTVLMEATLRGALSLLPMFLAHPAIDVNAVTNVSLVLQFRTYY